jgi:hypothetical protein
MYMKAFTLALALATVGTTLVDARAGGTRTPEVCITRAPTARGIRGRDCVQPLHPLPSARPLL